MNFLLLVFITDHDGFSVSNIKTFYSHKSLYGNSKLHFHSLGQGKQVIPSMVFFLSFAFMGKWQAGKLQCHPQWPFFLIAFCIVHQHQNHNNFSQTSYEYATKNAFCMPEQTHWVEHIIKHFEMRFTGLLISHSYILTSHENYSIALCARDAPYTLRSRQKAICRYEAICCRG